MKIIARTIRDERANGRRTLRTFDVVGVGPRGVVEISPGWAWSVSLVYGDSLLSRLPELCPALVGRE